MPFESYRVLSLFDCIIGGNTLFRRLRKRRNREVRRSRGLLFDGSLPRAHERDGKYQSDAKGNTSNDLAKHLMV